MMSNASQFKLPAPTAGERFLERCARALPILLLPWLAVLAPATFAAPTPLGAQAPDFALPATSGGNVRLSEHRGEVVLITFWSSNCAICATQLHALDSLQETYRSAGLVTLGVSVDDDLVRARRYAAGHPLRFPLLLDRSKQVSRSYGIGQLPTTVLIDRRGRLRYMQSQDRGTDNSYTATVRELLDDPL